MRYKLLIMCGLLITNIRISSSLQTQKPSVIKRVWLNGFGYGLMMPLLLGGLGGMGGMGYGGMGGYGYPYGMGYGGYGYPYSRYGYGGYGYGGYGGYGHHGYRRHHGRR